MACIMASFGRRKRRSCVDAVASSHEPHRAVMGGVKSAFNNGVSKATPWQTYGSSWVGARPHPLDW